MVRPVRPAEVETPPGVVLTASQVQGGFTITRAGTYLGYVHAHANGRARLYRAYVRRIGADDEHLGVLGLVDAIAAVVTAWDAHLPTHNRREP